MTLGTAQIIRADSRNLPLPDNSVDLIVTSPPYFALRSYQDGGEHYDGQIGAEPTPDEFVDALLDVTRECVRVLKPSGSLWVNLGDKYSQRVAIRRSSHQDGLFPDRPDLPKDWKRDKERGLTRMPYQNITNPETGAYVPEKSLMGIPWRYALRCIDDLGLILRAEVIWSKPNGLPESVTDRVRRSHEQWFHFVQQPRYFSAVDEVREAHRSESGREGRGALGGQKAMRPVGPNSGAYNTLGALPGSVRTVPTEPLRVPDHLGVDHFAAFPTTWPKWIIQGWAPTKGVCTACGEGRRPSTATSHTATRNDRSASWIAGSAHYRTGSTEQGGKRAIGAQATITGYSCACPEPTAATTPPVILDPFGGTGTTALVAKALGCHGISVDMSADYCRLAEWRTNDPGQLAKVLGVDKPPEVDPAQIDLFDLGGDAA